MLKTHHVFVCLFLLKGSHSTKIVGVIKCLKQIKKDDPGAKVLLFCSVSFVNMLWAQQILNNLCGVHQRPCDVLFICNYSWFIYFSGQTCWISLHRLWRKMKSHLKLYSLGVNFRYMYFILINWCYCIKGFLFINK